MILPISRFSQAFDVGIPVCFANCCFQKFTLCQTTHSPLTLSSTIILMVSKNISIQKLCSTSRSRKFSPLRKPLSHSAQVSASGLMNMSCRIAIRPAVANLSMLHSSKPSRTIEKSTRTTLFSSVMRNFLNTTKYLCSREQKSRNNFVTL